MKYFTMKNFTNHTHISLPSWSVPNAVMFEVATVIISALVIFTSCWVLRYIYLKDSRSRTDYLFVVTSITDIGVGLFRLPLSGVNITCKSFIKCSALIHYLLFSTIFPFIFLSHYNSYSNGQTTSHNEALQVQNDCYNTKTEDHCSIHLRFKYWI